jgi:DNA mismatch repair ATPase MutS
MATMMRPVARQLTKGTTKELTSKFANYASSPIGRVVMNGMAGTVRGDAPSTLIEAFGDGVSPDTAKQAITEMSKHSPTSKHVQTVQDAINAANRNNKFQLKKTDRYYKNTLQSGRDFKNSLETPATQKRIEGNIKNVFDSQRDDGYYGGKKYKIIKTGRMNTKKNGKRYIRGNTKKNGKRYIRGNTKKNGKRYIKGNTKKSRRKSIRSSRRRR